MPNLEILEGRKIVWIARGICDATIEIEVEDDYVLRIFPGDICEGEPPSLQIELHEDVFGRDRDMKKRYKAVMEERDAVHT